MTRRNNRRSAVSRRIIRTNASRQRLNCAVNSYEDIRDNDELVAIMEPWITDVIAEAAQDADISPETAFKAALAGDYILYNDCDSMYDVAVDFLENSGILNKEQNWLLDYIDYEKLGINLGYDGYYGYSETLKGYVEFLL